MTEATDNTERSSDPQGRNEAVVNCPTAEQMITDCKKHPWEHTCGLCGEDVGRTAVVDLVYRHEACDCDIAPYTHLVERCYHTTCFVAVNKGS